VRRWLCRAATSVCRCQSLSEGDFGRGDWIRTSDLLNPIQVRYQTALRPDRGALAVYHAASHLLPAQSAEYRDSGAE
jgi:hypothetical protein